MYVCLCRGITERQVQKAINDGCSDYADVRKKLQIGTQCGKCAYFVKQIVKEELSNSSLKLGKSKIKSSMYVCA